MRHWFNRNTRISVLSPWFPYSSLGTKGSWGLGARWISKQRGMTLLELTVVLLILTSLATVALRSTSGLQDQARWEQTKKRYEAIRASIIGNPELNINGQPDINGFVADMGRLPLNIKELLSQNYCDNDYTETVDTGCAGNWKTNDDYFVGCSDGVSTDKITCEAVPANWHEIIMGWNGPYLLSSESSIDEDAFVDGWGNLPADVTDLDYGWNFTPDADPATNIILNSVGCASCDTPYDAAYPLPATNPGVSVNDWLVGLSGSGISVNLEPKFSGSCTVDEYTSPGTCEIAGGIWIGICTDGTSSNRWMCLVGGGSWVDNGCTDLVAASKTLCEASTVTTPPPPPPATSHIWVTPCSDNTYSTKATCEGATEEWTCSAAVTDSKLLCEGVGGTWTYTNQDIDLTITYRDGSGGVFTEVDTKTVMENGLNQQVNFSFAGSVIPMGINNILITKTGTGDIYPPSCSGLNVAVCEAADGAATDATLLDNGICDNVTLAECTAAGGALIRNTVQVPFVPYKTLPTINW